MRKFILFFICIICSTSFLSACGEDDDLPIDIIKNDTLIVNDTTIVYDTIVVNDTVFVNDTSIVKDTTVILDTIINNIDTIFKQYTIIKQYTVIKQDSIIKKETVTYTEIVKNPKLVLTHYMGQNSGLASVQGASCYGKYLFQFENKNANIYVYNLETKEFVAKISLEKNGNNHCNNASFSNIFYDSADKFPLLYVSGGSSSNYNKVQVYRIQEIDGNYSAHQIQEITTPTPTIENQLTWGCVAIDNDNQLMYFYGGTPVLMQYAKFKIPDIRQETVSLGNNDILEQFSMPSYIHPQGATIFKEIMYIVDGVPNWGDNTHLKIVDLKRKEQKIYNLFEANFNYEPEGLFFYDNKLLMVTNQNKGVYQISNYE